MIDIDAKLKDQILNGTAPLNSTPPAVSNDRMTSERCSERYNCATCPAGMVCANTAPGDNQCKGFRATAAKREAEAVRPWREALAEFFAVVDEEHPSDGPRSNPCPNHCHEKRGVWDWDNGEMAGKTCRECAAWDGLRALLQSGAEGGNDAKC